MRKLLLRTVCAMLCLAVVLGPSGWLPALREAAAAGATRVAVVTSLKGDVQVKKSGGAKFFNAFKNMSLNEGDMITTGKNSSVVLELASSKADQDSITIGENSQVQFTKLKEDTGAKAKMSVWAGSLWVKVKSISNADDTFEVETPTAIMGVRGTHFILAVDPLTGKTTLVVASGVMAAAKTAGTGAGPKNEVHVYPAQQMDVDALGQTTDPRATVEPADPETLVFTLPPDIVEAMVSNMADIRQENEALAQQLASSVGQGVGAPDPNANLFLVSDEDLAAYAQNMIALVVVVLSEAVNQGVIPEETARSIVEQVNGTIEDPGRHFSLDDVPEYRKDVGVDPSLQAEIERERQRKEEQQRQKEQRRQEQLEKNREKAEQIAETKSQLDQANQAAKSEKEQNAADRYKQSLSEEERAALEQRQREREQERQEQQQGDTGGSTGPDSGGSSPAPNPGTTLPVVAATASDYNFNVKTVDIRLSGFTGSRAVFGYQVDVEYDPQYFSFAESLFHDTSGLNPFRNVAESPFKVELEEDWEAPEGYDVNAVDHVNHDIDNHTVRYAVLKFEGGAEAVDGQIVVRLPFMLASIFETQQTAAFQISLTAVDGNGNVISGIQPVTVQVVIEPGTVQLS